MELIMVGEPRNLRRNIQRISRVVRLKRKDLKDNDFFNVSVFFFLSKPGDFDPSLRGLMRKQLREFPRQLQGRCGETHYL